MSDSLCTLMSDKISPADACAAIYKKGIDSDAALSAACVFGTTHYDKLYTAPDELAAYNTGRTLFDCIHPRCY